VSIPVQLASLAALAWAWRRRSEPDSAALRRTICAAALSSAFAAFILFCFAGAVTRYTTELFAGATVTTAIGLMVILSGSPGGPARNVIRLLAICLGAWTVGYVALASAEQRILFRKENPSVYAFAAHLLDYPSLWVARSEATVFGPVAISVRVPSEGGSPATVLLSSGRPGMMNELILERTDPGHARLVMAENLLSIVAVTPPLPVVGGRIVARIEAPWLYPPPQSPWWDAISDPALRGDLRTRFAMATAGQQTLAHTARFFDPTRFEPWVATRSSAGPSDAWVEALGPLPVPGR